MNEAQRLRQAREAARFSPEQMAELVEIDVSVLKAGESGRTASGPELLERYARVLGVSVERLLLDDIEHAPAPLLFRSLHGTTSIDELPARSVLELGDFLRTVSDVGNLAERAARHGAPRWHPLRELEDLPPERPPAETEKLYRRTERLAMAVRERLGLGLAPIHSMVTLIEERLEIPIVWAGPDQLDPEIDGASAYERAPGILVNLVGGPQRWWRTRMTLAHELCHILFDVEVPKGSSSRRFFMFSPDREQPRRAGAPLRYQLPIELEQIERRANVFAAHLIAPGAGIRDLVSRANATSEDAITLVCQHFGVGRITAVNQLTNVFVLSREERRRMLDPSRPSGELPQPHDDARVTWGARSRCDFLERRTYEALAAGWIGRVHARDVLGLRATEPLPIQSRLPEELRAPTRTVAQTVGLRAQTWLGSRRDTATWRAGEPILDGDRWRVAVFEVDDAGTRKDRGTLVLSRSFEVIEDECRLLVDGTSA